MFKKVSVSTVGETPNVLQADIPTGVQLPGPGSIQVPCTASKTATVEKCQDLRMYFWKHLVNFFLEIMASIYKKSPLYLY